VNVAADGQWDSEAGMLPLQGVEKRLRKRSGDIPIADGHWGSEVGMLPLQGVEKCLR